MNFPPMAISASSKLPFSANIRYVREYGPTILTEKDSVIICRPHKEGNAIMLALPENSPPGTIYNILKDINFKENENYRDIWILTPPNVFIDRNGQWSIHLEKESIGILLVKYSNTFWITHQLTKFDR